MAKRGRWAGREAEMRGLLEKWERGDLPLSRFADREGIGVRTISRWRRRLGVGEDRIRRGRPPKRAEDRAGAMFTEVSGVLSQVSSSTVMFEVVLGDGTKVRVSEHFDPTSLRILLATLREC